MPALGRDPFLICNTDAFWIEGPRSNIARLADAFDPEAMDVALLVAAAAGAVGVDWPGDFTMTRDGRLSGREPRHVAPFVYTGVGIIKPQLFDNEAADVFRLAPFFHAAAAAGRLFGVRLDGLWLHVGRPETITEAERAIERSNCQIRSPLSPPAREREEGSAPSPRIARRKMGVLSNHSIARPCVGGECGRIGGRAAAGPRDPPARPGPTIGRPEGRPSFDGLWGAGAQTPAILAKYNRL